MSDLVPPASAPVAVAALLGPAGDAKAAEDALRARAVSNDTPPGAERRGLAASLFDPAS